MEKSGADKESAADLRLSEGLVEAAKGEATAWDSLQKFVRDFPQSPRLSEAWVALAELAFHATPPRLEEARKNLQRALEAKPTEVATEHADYLSIWLEDAASGITFRERYPDEVGRDLLSASGFCQRGDTI